jgi:hypothetical protein
VFDTGGFYDNAGGSKTLIVPAASGGLYLATGWVEWDANGTGTRIVSLEKNGPDGAGSYFARNQRDAAANVRMSVTGIVILAAADTVSFTLFQNSGGVRTVDSHMTLIKLSGTP